MQTHAPRRAAKRTPPWWRISRNRRRTWASLRDTVRPPSPEELVPGVRVRVRGLPSAVLLRRRDGTSAEIEAGPLRMKVPLSEIIAFVTEADAKRGASAGSRENAGAKAARESRSGVTVHTVPADRERGATAGDEINVIGCTVEEATRRVDKFIDSAALGGHAAGARDSRARHGRIAARPGGIPFDASAGRKRSRRGAGARRDGGDGGGAARLI